MAVDSEKGNVFLFRNGFVRSTDLRFTFPGLHRQPLFLMALHWQHGYTMQNALVDRAQLPTAIDTLLGVLGWMMASQEPTQNQKRTKLEDTRQNLRKTLKNSFCFC